MIEIKDVWRACIGATSAVSLAQPYKEKIARLSEWMTDIVLLGFKYVVSGGVTTV